MTNWQFLAILIVVLGGQFWVLYSLSNRVDRVIKLIEASVLKYKQHATAA
jgi:hypothetical protein